MGKGVHLLGRSAGVTSTNNFRQVGSSSCGLTAAASIPGYQLKRLTMPSACTLGLVASGTNSLASLAFAALAGTTQYIGWPVIPGPISFHSTLVGIVPSACQV